MKRTPLAVVLLLVLTGLLGSTPALAQQPAARIAYLGPGSAKTFGIMLDGLKEGLRENSLIEEGKDYVLDVRWAEGRYERFPAMVDELLRFSPSVIVPGTIAALPRQGFRAVLIGRDAALLDWREELSSAALKNRLPVIGPQPEYARVGALIGYGSSTHDNYRRSAIYVKKILAGMKPADLAVEQPTLLFLWLNMKTARSLRIDIPQAVFLRADRVID